MSVNKEAKIKHIQKLIQTNYSSSGNAIYKSLKGTKYGIRKQDFYKVFNRTKQSIFLKKPSKKFKIKDDTAKVKLIIPKKQPKTYFITKVTNKESGQKYYLVYTTNPEARKQLSKLLSNYQINKMYLRFGKTVKHKYQVSFIAPEFQKYLLR